MLANGLTTDKPINYCSMYNDTNKGLVNKNKGLVHTTKFLINANKGSSIPILNVHY